MLRLMKIDDLLFLTISQANFVFLVAWLYDSSSAAGILSLVLTIAWRIYFVISHSTSSL